MAAIGELYRALSGSFPTGVCVVTTVDEVGIPRGLTTQSYVGLSLDPPLMLISVDKTSRTLAALQHRKAFAINFLRSGADAVSTLFASKADDKFAGLAWKASQLAGGSPLLVDHSVAIAECRLHDAFEAGDHHVFIGRVEGGSVLGGVPLMYYKRTYAAWPEEKPAPPVS